MNDETMLSLMSEQKKPEKNEIVLPYDALQKYFPKNSTPHQMERMIYKLLESWQKKTASARRKIIKYTYEGQDDSQNRLSFFISRKLIYNTKNGD